MQMVGPSLQQHYRSRLQAAPRGGVSWLLGALAQPRARIMIISSRFFFHLYSPLNEQPAGRC